MSTKRSIFYVPWADVSEWNTVRDQIFSSDIKEIKRAYETILMWKLKYPDVPAYVESTYSLLQVMIKEYEMTINEKSVLIDEHDLRLCYSTALIRFVNHVTCINSYKGQTLYSAAKIQNIPDWIINLRHDAAHGQHLPTLDALHIASELSLQWLLDNYWNSEENVIPKDLVLSQINSNLEISLEVNINAQNLFQKAFNLWELCCQKKYKKFLPIIDMGQEFILYLEEILELNHFYFRGLENDSTEYLQWLVNGYDPRYMNETYIRKNYKTPAFKRTFLKFLKNLAVSHDSIKRSLVSSLMETSFLSESSLESNKWEKVIHLVQELGLFSFLLRVLFQMAGKGNRGAALWLNALPYSIEILKRKWAMFKVLRKENNNFKTKLLKSRVHNINKKMHSGTIYLEIFKPPIITLDMIICLIKNPEYVKSHTIIRYVRLMKKPLSEPLIKLLEQLIYLHKQNDGLYIRGQKRKKYAKVLNSCVETDDWDECDENDEIFTVEDLEREAEKQVKVVYEKANTKGNRWAKSSIGVHVWSKCPLGLLPFQTKVDCRLPENLIWKRIVPVSKDTPIPLVKHTLNVKKLQDL